MHPLHILLVDLDSPCPIGHCIQLAALLQRALSGREIRLQTTTVFPPTTRVAPPDLILLRPSLEKPSREALCSCRRNGHMTPMLGLFCHGWEDPQHILHTLHNDLDDFISCPFTEIDLFRRLQRLLHSKSGEVTASPLKTV
jgi:hypothetical protein